jgi:hypothetical protein
MSTGPAATLFASGMASETVVRPPERVILLSRRVMARHADVFGGVKIPRFEALKSTADAGGWKDVSRLLEPEDFAALIGLRVVGLPNNISNNSNTETHFSLESSYLSADCQPFVQLPYPSYNRTPPATVVEGMSRRMSFNFSAAVARAEMPGDRVVGRGAFRPFLFDLDRDGSVGRSAAFLGLGSYIAMPADPKIANQRRAVFGSRYIRMEGNGGGRQELINMANCTLRQTQVETAVVCPRNSHGGGGGCRARRMRLSLTDRRPQSLTWFDSPLLAARFLRLLSAVYTSGTSNSSSQMERFIVGGSGSYATLPRKVDDPYEFVDVSSVPLATVNRRLSLILNSLFMALVMRNNPDLSRLARYQNASTPRHDIDMFVRRGPAATAAAEAGADDSARLVEAIFAALGRAAADGLPFVPAATTATATAQTPIYVCQFAWMATLLASAAALLVVAGAAALLALPMPLPLPRHALAPDTLRYAASLTYANRHVRAPAGGTALDGFERARRLGRMRVQIGDVRGAGAVGEVAFVATDDVEVRRLDAKRLYR